MKISPTKLCTKSHGETNMGNFKQVLLRRAFDIQVDIANLKLEKWREQKKLFILCMSGLFSRKDIYLLTYFIYLIIHRYISKYIESSDFTLF